MIADPEKTDDEWQNEDPANPDDVDGSRIEMTMTANPDDVDDSRQVVALEMTADNVEMTADPDMMTLKTDDKWQNHGIKVHLVWQAVATYQFVQQDGPERQNQQVAELTRGSSGITLESSGGPERQNQQVAELTRGSS